MKMHYVDINLAVNSHASTAAALAGNARASVGTSPEYSPRTPCALNTWMHHEMNKLALTMELAQWNSKSEHKRVSPGARWTLTRWNCSSTFLDSAVVSVWILVLITSKGRTAIQNCKQGTRSINTTKSAVYMENTLLHIVRQDIAERHNFSSLTPNICWMQAKNCCHAHNSVFTTSSHAVM